MFTGRVGDRVQGLGRMAEPFLKAFEASALGLRALELLGTGAVELRYSAAAEGPRGSKVSGASLSGSDSEIGS